MRRTIYCVKCGTEVDKSMNFCDTCGGQLKKRTNELTTMKNPHKTFYDEINDILSQLDEDTRRQIYSKLNYIPKIGFLGKTQVGKSKICSRLFGKELFKSGNNVDSCTRHIQDEELKIGDKKIIVTDVPGLGESIERDKEYSKEYEGLIPKLDALLWVIRADETALALDEKFYKDIIKPYLKKEAAFFIVLNKCDIVEPPDEWNKEKNEPGVTQNDFLSKKKEYVSKFFNVSAKKVIPVSAKYNYNIPTLFEKIIFALPDDAKHQTYEAGSEDIKTDTAKEEAENGVLRTILSVLKNIKDGAVFVVDKLGNLLENAREIIGGVGEILKIFKKI